MSPPTSPQPLVAFTYPLERAIARNRVLVFACNRAINEAMRRLHGVPADIPNLADFDDDVAQQISEAYLSEAAHRYHIRMNVDERTCRWCGEAAERARKELDDDDG